mgnify:CR=1 FL=1
MRRGEFLGGDASQLLQIRRLLQIAEHPLQFLLCLLQPRGYFFSGQQLLLCDFSLLHLPLLLYLLHWGLLELDQHVQSDRFFHLAKGCGRVSQLLGMEIFLYLRCWILV